MKKSAKNRGLFCVWIDSKSDKMYNKVALKIGDYAHEELF